MQFCYKQLISKLAKNFSLYCRICIVQLYYIKKKRPSVRWRTLHRMELTRLLLDGGKSQKELQSLIASAQKCRTAEDDAHSRWPSAMAMAQRVIARLSIFHALCQWEICRRKKERKSMLVHWTADRSSGTARCQSAVTANAWTHCASQQLYLFATRDEHF